MPFFRAFLEYFRREKTRREIVDYLRTLLIIASSAAVIKAVFDMLP